MEKQVLIYALAGIREMYVPVKYWVLNDPSISDIVACAYRIKDEVPSATRIYAIDNVHGLKRAYSEAIKGHQSRELAPCCDFKDWLERQGIRII